MSRDWSGVGFRSRFSSWYGGMVDGDVRSIGSCLMLVLMSYGVSAGEAGLAAASIEPRDSTSEGVGVSALV